MFPVSFLFVSLVLSVSTPLFLSLCPPLSCCLSFQSLFVSLCFFLAVVCWSQLPSTGPGELILQISFQPSIQQVTSVT